MVNLAGPARSAVEGFDAGVTDDVVGSVLDVHDD